MANIDKRNWQTCKAIIDDPSASDAEKASAQARMDDIKKWLDSKKTEETKSQKSPPPPREPTTVKCDWPESSGIPDGIVETLLSGDKVVTAIAVDAVVAVHPGIDTTSNLFGTMVSAKTGHLLQLMQIEATNKMVSALENLATKKAK